MKAEAAPKTLFIAEVSSNHNADLERSLQFIDTAASIGCDGVKFQLFRVNQLFAPEVLTYSEDHRQRREWELPQSFLPRLSEHSAKHGLLFSCTPFDLPGVGQLEPFVDFIKIASYEILWKPLLVRCAESGRPVVLSTGMATLREIEEAVETLRANGCKELSLLHCVSGYPPPPTQCNLAAIETLRKRFQCSVGWSDHTRNAAVIQRAVHRWKASMIEFHLDLEGSGREYQLGHCWLPEEIAAVIQSISLALTADGDGRKEPLPCEESDRLWRADPADGLRPLRPTRRMWLAEKELEVARQGKKLES